jgi:hypothetical protein
MNLRGRREGGSKRWRPPSGVRGREQELGTRRHARERAGHQRHAREGAGGGMVVARCERCEQEMLAGFVVV